MRKLISFVLTIACMFCLSACGGSAKNVKITDYTSKIYSNAEIESAIDNTPKSSDAFTRSNRGTNPRDKRVDELLQAGSNQ